MVRTFSSWSGSERQRRSQGTCRPPAVSTNATSRYTIPAGTKLFIRKVLSTKDWVPYKTHKTLGFERFERRNQGEYTFRESGYFIRVNSKLVKYRQR